MFKDFCYAIKNEKLYKKKYENNDKRNRNLSALRKDIEFVMKKKNRLLVQSFCKKQNSILKDQ